MTDDTLTALLAERVMGWKLAPDRFIKSGRSWIPRWRFQPLVSVADAFELLERMAASYALTSDGETFRADVNIGSCVGSASGKRKAEVITKAIARTLEIDFEVKK